MAVDEYRRGEIMCAYGLARNWWLMVLRGLCAVGLGLAALVRPNLTLVALVLLFGVYLLVDGLLAVIAGLTRSKGSRPWWLLLIEGLIGIGAGVVAVLLPGLTAIALLYLLAAWALLTGTVEIVSAIRLRKDIESEGLLALSGILSITLGAVLVIWPQASGLALVWLMGSYALAFGLLLMGLGLRLWNWQWSVRRASNDLSVAADAG